jgi:hypothetical protein
MGMRDRSKKTAKKVDGELAAQELELLTDTNFDLVSLTPEITSDEDYDKLIATINNASTNNLGAAKLNSQIKELGEGAERLVLKIISALS